MAIDEDFFPDLFDMVEEHAVEVIVDENPPSEMLDPAVAKFFNAMDVRARELSEEQCRLFIAHYAQYHSVKDAAKYAGGPIASFKHRRKIDPVFDEMWLLAREHWTDALEETGMYRATADVEQRYAGASNDMLKFMLKARGDGYTDTVNVNHGGGKTPIRVAPPVSLDHLDEDEKADLRQLSRRAITGKRVVNG